MTKNALFLLVAGLFLFTYPKVNWNYNLGTAIGWHTTIGRGWSSFLWSMWFLLVYFSYQRLAKKNKPIKQFLFWTHFSVSIVPAFVINYPFKIWFLQNVVEFQDELRMWSLLNRATLIYFLLQVIFGVFIFIKLIKVFKR